MDLIYDFPAAHGPDVDMFGVGDVASIAAALEQAGWYGLSFTEHPAPSANWLGAGGHQSVDPLIALGHAAAVTSQLRLLTYLVVAPYRNPLLLAKAAATVDVLSSGRLILGLGTGYLKSEFRALGVDFEERNALFDEALDVLPKYWSGQPFDYEGMHFSARGIQGMPAPSQQTIPIWIGGNAAVTRRRVAERAQGWMPLPGSPEQTAYTRTPALAGIDDLATKIADVKQQAAHRDGGLDFVYVYQNPALWSEPGAQRHVDAIGELGSAGITKVVLNGPVGVSKAENLEWIRQIAAELLVR